MARRSPWINDKAALLVRLLRDRYDLTISEDIAREDISAHVDLVAAAMRIGRQAAKPYVTDDTISTLADRIGKEVHRQRTKRALRPQRHLTAVP
jgi:hypothetical protein